MVEKYFAMKLTFAYIAIALSLLPFVIAFAICVIDEIKQARKISLLKRSGFERYLHSVPSFGDGAFYGWRRESDGKKFLESELKRVSYKKLKQEVDK